MDSSTSRVIGSAALVSVSVGTLNSFYKTKKPPALKFFIGSAAAYVILSGIGEVEPNVAKALAVAIAVTMIFGEGNGALKFLDTHGETDTRPKSAAGEIDPLVSSADQIYSSEPVEVADTGPGQWTNDSSLFSTKASPPYTPDTVGAFPGVSY